MIQAIQCAPYQSEVVYKYTTGIMILLQHLHAYKSGLMTLTLQYYSQLCYILNKFDACPLSLSLSLEPCIWWFIRPMIVETNIIQRVFVFVRICEHRTMSILCKQYLISQIHTKTKTQWLILMHNIITRNWSIPPSLSHSNPVLSLRVIPEH